MKIDGNKPTFMYSSNKWTQKQAYQQSSLLNGLDSTEMVSPAYWRSPLSKLCLGMKSNNQISWIMVPLIPAQSLRSLLASNKVTNTHLGQDKWKSLLSNSYLVNGCQREGLNVFINNQRVRIGMVAAKSCAQPGGNMLGFGSTASVVCGNYHSCSSHGIIRRRLFLGMSLGKQKFPEFKHRKFIVTFDGQPSFHGDKISVDFFPFNLVSTEKILRTLQRSDIGKIFVSHTDPANSTAEGEQVTQHFTGTGERIEFVIHTKDSDHNPSYSENDRVTVRIQSKQGFVIPTRIEDKKEGTYIASYTPLKTGIYQIDAKVRGEPIKGSPFTVHVTTRAEYLKASRMSLENCVTNPEYKPLFSLCQVTCKDRPHLKRPCGIAISSSDEVAVADSWNRRILLFNPRGKYITQFEGTEDLTNPVGVDFDFDGNIVVSDSDNQLIHVIDRCDVTIRTFGSEVLECPWGVCVTPKGRIAVCDWGSASVKEFSQQGKLIKEFSSGSTSKPYYIIHHSDKYFISFDSHCVEVFSANGEFLYTFAEKGSGKGQLRDPRGMTIDSKDNLVVCDSGNHRLLVFTTDGRAYAVGTSGKALGRFDKPQDAAISSDGRLFVTDYSNNQVQILQKNSSTRSLSLSE
ncbi:PREDICTED: E3 ubiquitin-protein ligase TRIM71-like [Acropora digitifera]|uniref:E3 ubiquitin-protein ligase TRIM71-like n=1 Tax=Acropora digitifera TaxID=70779 RepID=UPI00077A373B|nr:PREDICTED: E3 ubiquitin-protein ligase TRIM71-like [Acropora digitifera]